MEYRSQLCFLRKLLRDMNISSCVLEEPGKHIPPEIDMFLRADLFGLSNYADFLQNSMSQAKDKTIYRFCDEYHCNYIFLRLPEPDTYFFIGPYLLAQPTEQQIEQKALSLDLLPEHLQRMHLYYTTLPLIEDENLLLSMANTLATHLWGTPEQYVMEYVEYAIPDRYEPIPYSLTPGQAEANLTDLSTLFHKEVGCTLTDYINKQRIEQSIHLLRLTSKPVQEIAAECGYQDVNYFIKLFKKPTRFTPKQYRETTAKNE